MVKTRPLRFVVNDLAGELCLAQVLVNMHLSNMNSLIIFHRNLKVFPMCVYLLSLAMLYQSYVSTEIHLIRILFLVLKKKTKNEKVGRRQERQL